MTDMNEAMEALKKTVSVCVCVCMCACGRMYVRACVCVCVYVCVALSCSAASVCPLRMLFIEQRARCGLGFYQAHGRAHSGARNTCMFEYPNAHLQHTHMPCTHTHMFTQCLVRLNLTPYVVCRR